MTARVRYGSAEKVIKVCTKCGNTFTKAQWERLPQIGLQVIPAWKDEPEEILDLRNDVCGSTLAISSWSVDAK